MMDYRILPPEGMLEATVTLPLSKSVSARALVMNALTRDKADLSNRVSDCDDTRMLSAALADTSADTVNLHNNGTAMRFVTALAAATPGRCVTLEGDRRPIGALVNTLRALGADITYKGEEGYLPVHICGKNLDGGQVMIDPTVSSQFVSALMMIAPLMAQGLTIDFEQECPSMPYIRMTAAMMAERGVDVTVHPMSVRVEPGIYKPVGEDWKCERDWSAASYWYEIAALSAGWIEFDDMSLNSVQGDRTVAKYFERLGVLTDRSEEHPDTRVALTPSPETYSRFEADMSGHPDLVPAVAVTCALLRVPMHITGIASLKHKECDRLEALADELAKIGCMVEIRPAGELYWDGRMIPIGVLPDFDTHNDHRMAMALATVALYLPGIIIRNAECVDKSFPGFWDALTQAGFTLLDPEQPFENE